MMEAPGTENSGLEVEVLSLLSQGREWESGGRVTFCGGGRGREEKRKVKPGGEINAGLTMIPSRGENRLEQG